MCKLGPETQLGARLGDKVLVVDVAAEVVYFKMRVKAWKCCIDAAHVITHSKLMVQRQKKTKSELKCQYEEQLTNTNPC